MEVRNLGKQILFNMQNSEETTINIAIVNNLNIIDQVYTSVVGQLNAGNYYISKIDESGITFNNQDFVKQVRNTVIVQTTILIGMAILIWVITILVSDNVISLDIANTTTNVLGLFFILGVYLLIRSIFIIKRQVVFKENGIYSLNAVGFRSILLDSSQNAFIVNQTNTSFIEEFRLDAEEDSKSENGGGDKVDDSRNLISFRKTIASSDVPKVLVSYDPESSSVGINQTLIDFLTGRFKNWTYENRIGESSNI